MYSKELEGLVARLEYYSSEEGWYELRHLVGEFDAWTTYEELLGEVNRLYEEGYYTSREARYIVKH